jgi:KaiC/GvpD/RAD55 family RecA-like ATPase
MLTLNELEDELKKGEQTRWLIENLIPMGELTIMYGQTDHYKTFLSLKIALEVATGSQELGATQSGKVILINTDTTSQQDIFLRVKGLQKANYSDHDLSESLLFNDGYVESAELNYFRFDLTAKHYLNDPKGLAYEDGTFEPEIIDWNEAYAYEYLNQNLKLIIIDTLSQSIGANSVNDDTAIRKVISNLKEIIKACDRKIAILIVAHASLKNPSKGIMGSSIQHNDFQSVLRVKKSKSNYALLREKLKSAAKGSSIPFKMRSISVVGHETLYVDIGKEFIGIEAEILRLNDLNLDKAEIKMETHKLYGEKYASTKSFDVSFQKYWKKLIAQGFLKDKKLGNFN